jgi:predicted dehydrogenase
VHTVLLFGLMKVRMAPLLALRATVSSLARGVMDLSPRAAVNSGDEFGELARDLNHFLDRITQVVSDLDRILAEVLAVGERLGALNRHLERQLEGLRDESLRALGEGAQRGLDTRLVAARESGAFGALVQHFEAAIAAGKHVFLEKPVAVDAPGVRKVLAAAELAKQKKLAVVSGLQRHHQNGYLEAMQRIHAGQLGKLLYARCSWNMGSLWHRGRDPKWSDMEWQLRNWLYFTWLSGDHIVEQHVHNIDVVNWALKGHPMRARGMGGRQVRTDAKWGNIFDHHAVQFEYQDGVMCFSECRQIDGCANDVSEHVYGADGACHMDSGNWRIEGKNAWKFAGQGNDPYQTEHDDLFASIRSGNLLNEGQMVAESTMSAILGRMATYTGKVVTWDDAMASNEVWGPEKYEFGALAVDAVPVPGKSKKG